MRIDHSDYARGQYKIDAPKAVKYLYGWTKFEYRIGQARDEHAWTAALEYTDHSTAARALQLAVLYLRPGISKREAYRAVDQMYEAFPPMRPPHRPGLYAIERQILRGAFEKMEQMAGKALPPKMLVSVASSIYTLLATHLEREPLSKKNREKGNELLSIKSIENECRQWRRETGRSTRYYLTERTDRRQGR